MKRRDPSDRRRQPAPSAASPDERLRLILENIVDYAIFTLDAGRFVTEWHEGAERVKGWKPEEIIGHHVSTFYTPEQVADGCVERELEEATKTGRAERETWRVRKGGELFWGNEIATAMRDEHGRLIGFTKITRDLSERKRVEDALRQSEEQYRLIVDNARDYAIFMIDASGRVMTWNTGAQRIFGYADSEIIAQDAAVLFTPEDRAAGEHQKELATAVAEGRASDDRWQMRKGGERFFASGVSTPLRDPGGTLRGFVKICRDLTEYRQIEEQRERLLEQEKVARLEAERAMVLRDEFLAVVSHELRTPLTAVLLWIKMLRSGALKREDYPRIFETIQQSAEAQRQLIEDLLDVSSVITGKLHLDVRDADLAPVIRAAVDAVQPMADAKEIRIDAALDEHSGCVRADPDRIQQVVWNLLNNAVKFSERGGQVRVRMRRSAGNLHIQVTDAGRGISPQFLPHVFERFRQADASTTRMLGGLGLGLSISKQLVELHGGSIRAESAGEGQGATFTVELPLSEISESTMRRGAPLPISAKGIDSEAPAPEPQPTPVLRGVRVLVVEDEPHTRSAIQHLLEGCDAEVTAVESAALAVAAFREKLSERRYDVVLSDIGMPVQDGYELLHEIRNMERSRGEQRPTPAVALTAYAREEDRARALAAGFQTHLPKPVEPGPLIQLVSRLAGRAE